MKQLRLFSKKIPFTHSRFFPQYRFIASQFPYHVILESGRGGRYSFAAFQPETVMIGKNNQLELRTNHDTQLLKGNPLHLMKEWMNEHQVEKNDELPDFQGGGIGYISYDYVRYLEKLPEIAEDDLQIPDVYFLIYKEWFVFDHKTDVLWLLFLYEEGQLSFIEKEAAQWEKKWLTDAKQWPNVRHNERTDDLEVSLNKEEFHKAAIDVQDYIGRGDSFQVNLSVRQTKQLQIPAIEVYEQLRSINPSPYMGYFHTPDFQLVSGSPELLIKKNGQKVSTRPIAGTRSRGRNDQEDLKLANELIQNEKERAEHLMLVDLERNDLGRVCEFGSVEVDEFMVIEKYSHVMHIVSNVKGKLANGKNGFDLIDAVFPGGTITGAPKVRTMEIIEELEPVRRGMYTGSMGWINFNGDLELNIIIRTMLVKEGNAHVQAGAGIVIDSNPEYEYKESLKKAMALWKAKELAETDTDK